MDGCLENYLPFETFLALSAGAKWANLLLVLRTASNFPSAFHKFQYILQNWPFQSHPERFTAGDLNKSPMQKERKMIFFPNLQKKLWEMAVNLQGCKASKAPPKALPPLLLHLFLVLPKVRAFLPSERFPAPKRLGKVGDAFFFAMIGMEIGGLFPHDLGIRGHCFFAMDIPNWINWVDLGCWFGWFPITL